MDTFMNFGQEEGDNYREFNKILENRLNEGGGYVAEQY